ncbi:MAG: hypothetical protein ACAH41_13900, partial [Ideonella sp.]
AGALLPILVDRAPPPMPVHLVHAAHQQQPLKLRAFLEFVAPRLQQRLQAISDDVAGSGQVRATVLPSHADTTPVTTSASPSA